MLPLTPVRLIAAASSTPAQPDDDQGLKFVNRCGLTSHLDYPLARSFWPLPRLASCEALAEFADANGILKEEPVEGDIFLRYCMIRRRFVRAGIIANIDLEYVWESRSVYLCTVVEAGLSRGCALSPLTGDRFIRWADLEVKRHAA